jgi:hypothetical protein
MSKEENINGILDVIWCDPNATKSIQLLVKIINNILTNSQDLKYRMLSIEKVVPKLCDSAVELLLAIGFHPNEGSTHFVIEQSKKNGTLLV